MSKCFAQKLTRMTQGSNALADYKASTKKHFDYWFPVPDYDEDIRQSYKGGFTYLNPKYADVDIKEGIVLDVNSLYPYVLHDMPMPYGEGHFFEGEYVEDERHPLYIQMFTCHFCLKENYIPTIQLKHNLSFVPTEYQENSVNTEGVDEEVALCLTSVDLKLFFEHYYVWDITYISGWKFKSSTNMFKAYVDKWIDVKIKADQSGNKGLRQIAKLMMNSLYGKFALNPNVRSKYPYLKDDVVHYENGPKEKRKPIYIPVGAFTTAWARYITISSAQKCYDRFIYADTDSLHLEGLDVPDFLDIHPTKLGAWKHESSFCRARYLRQKTYIEEELSNSFYLPDKDTYGNTNLKITCCGLQESSYKYVNWDNFHLGAVYGGKLKTKRVKGGIVLVDGVHTLRY